VPHELDQQVAMLVTSFCALDGAFEMQLPWHVVSPLAHALAHDRMLTHDGSLAHALVTAQQLTAMHAAHSADATMMPHADVPAPLLLEPAPLLLEPAPLLEPATPLLEAAPPLLPPDPLLDMSPLLGGIGATAVSPRRSS
jgi:hypothetical protein